LVLDAVPGVDERAGFVGADARGGAGNKIVELCLVAVAR
jgi:hypothetical protein